MSRPLSSFSPARQPFLYLTTAFVAGIVADRMIHLGRPSMTAAVFIALATSTVMIRRRRGLAASLLVILGIAAAGALLSLLDRTSSDNLSLASRYESRLIPPGPLELTGTLAAPPEPAPGAYYLDVSAESIVVPDQTIPVTGRARLTIHLGEEQLRRQFSALALDYGSRVRVVVALERARQFSNPGSPDFNEFLERRGYDLKGTIKSPLLIEKVGYGPRNPALAFLYHLRLKLISAIDSRFKPRSAGMLKAMLAGNRYFLDAGAVERLREGSTFHTLVIAGLHIGIIAWVLLGGRSARRRRAAIRVMVCIVILWAYAIMVGLAPPVTRATTMITVGLIGPLLFRQAASVNTVALAAFVMLAVKPALVADPGFQLSFAAVAGIVGLALPVADKLRSVGQWRPTSRTPHPPACSAPLRQFAEVLFWDAQGFEADMRHAPVRYRLPKARAARLLGRWRIQPALRGAVLLIITSASIQLSTLPLMALYFNRVAPVGVLLNVVAGLLTGVMMLAGLGAIGLGWVSAWAASALEHVVNASRYLMVNGIAPFSGLPFATFRVAHYEGPQALVYALYFAPLVMLAVLIDRWRPVDHIFPIEWTDAARGTRRSAATSPRRSVTAPLVCALSTCAAVAAVVNPPIQRPTGKLTIHFLDVGQGDSALIVFPRGKTMLIDGGGELRFGAGENGGATPSGDGEESYFAGSGFSIGEAVVSRYIWSLGRTRVDYALATHAHADHIGGLCDVVRNLDVREAIVGYAVVDDPEYERFARAARERRTPIYTVTAEEKFEIDGVTIEVLWPPPAEGRRVTSGNDDSVVLRFVYGSVSMLLAGDVEQRAEESLVRSGVNLHADILKVPHHGSKTSSTDAFIDAVNPRYAVISVGERSQFGHPHPSVVNHYVARGVKLFQTGRDGMVAVEVDGSTFDIQAHRKPSR